ncbi:MAG: two-component system, OmpR family, alkaline phosphatase synthesis response regulator PhoP [Chloroflexota bacterium]|jgi:CheY-like chemotaxis protein|nr:two-component system, OmpR family, alkaline phosphatase synthesis response regulator PhoP [Chloroflexota bacterium]
METAGDGPPLDIVLGEDDPDLALLNERVLTRDGHRVHVTRDGEATLEAVRAENPDLVLLDLELPRGDGLAVVEQLRADPATAGQAIAVMSNKDLTRPEEQRLMRLGVVDFLAKWKVGPLVLTDWIRRWLAGQIRRFGEKGRRI